MSSQNNSHSAIMATALVVSWIFGWVVNGVAVDPFMEWMQDERWPTWWFWLFDKFSSIPLYWVLESVNGPIEFILIAAGHLVFPIIYIPMVLLTLCLGFIALVVELTAMYWPYVLGFLLFCGLLTAIGSSGKEPKES